MRARSDSLYRSIALAGLTNAHKPLANSPKSSGLAEASRKSRSDAGVQFLGNHVDAGVPKHGLVRSGDIMNFDATLRQIGPSKIRRELIVTGRILRAKQRNPSIIRSRSIGS